MGGRNIVVVGAGVVGLTTALLLSRNSLYKVTIVAKHMPGDHDIEYTSPWAGANHMPFGVRGSAAAEWERNTWLVLENLARNHPESGIHFQECRVYNTKKDVKAAAGTEFEEMRSSSPWYKDLYSDFRILPQSDLAPEIDNAFVFTSVCINPAIYLPYLAGQLLKAGVIIKRATLGHVCEAAKMHHSGKKADLIVNCTGISASKLGGVADKAVIPARGQTVLVRNVPGAMAAFSGSAENCADDELTYVMERAGGGGTILGGCYQKGNWDSQPDPNLAVRIMKRCVELYPQLTGGKGIEHLDIIRHQVGLRPLRLDGTRVEKERIDGTLVVHNYGHGSFGYQTSYGCSQDAVKLVEDALKERARL